MRLGEVLVDCGTGKVLFNRRKAKGKTRGSRHVERRLCGRLHIWFFHALTSGRSAPCAARLKSRAGAKSSIPTPAHALDPSPVHMLALLGEVWGARRFINEQSANLNFFQPNLTGRASSIVPAY